jgi:hypothetical protein
LVIFIEVTFLTKCHGTHLVKKDPKKSIKKPSFNQIGYITWEGFGQIGHIDFTLQLQMNDIDMVSWRIW